MKNLFGYKSVKEDYTYCVSDVVPGQAMDLVDLWNRFNRGQRLLVNQRPINLYECDEDGNFYDPNVRDEDYLNTLPDIEDRVDLEEYIEENKSSLKSIKEEKNRRNLQKEQKEKEDKKEEDPK